MLSEKIDYNTISKVTGKTNEEIKKQKIICNQITAVLCCTAAIQVFLDIKLQKN